MRGMIVGVRHRFARTASAATAGYLLGMIPFADVASRIATRGTVDLRTVGSGNPGATNASAVLGKRWGAAVLAADVAKAAAACAAGRALAGDAGAHIGGTASVIGHCFPAWNGFRGGKGVACGVGQCLATFPAYFPIGAGLGAVAVTSTSNERTFAAATAMAAGWVAHSIVWSRRGKATRALPLAAAASSAVILGKFLAAVKPPA